MLGKVLGFLDIATGICIVLMQINFMYTQLLIAFASYLILKAIIFFGDFMSIIDGVIGIYMIIMLIYKVEVVSIIFALFLLFKGLWSMF